jgi:UDP-hydrolysing UDP-N-acetyl-D-glucosamine 2-epimerase
VSGAPALDGIADTQLWTREEIISRLGSVFDQPPLLVTYHPVTLEHDDTRRQVEQLFQALDRFDVPIVFTAPNADTGGRAIRVRIDEFVRGRPLAVLVENLGPVGYLSLMAYARAMVGNSSSGIIEAPSFELPVVNIGTRQKGRIRAPNVIDAAVDFQAIQSGIRFALSSQFRESLREMSNPYGSGGASRIIVENLKRLFSEQLIPKRFCDLSSNDTSMAPVLRTHKQ